MFPRLLWTRVGLVVAHHICRWLQSSVVAVLAALLAYFPFKEINEPGYSFNLVRGHVT